MLEATGGARSGCQKWVPEWTLDGGSHGMGRVDWRIGGLACCASVQRGFWRVGSPLQRDAAELQSKAG